ncbi:response regulator transcription factor [Paenibacillus psychroresistens]|nr:response regulator [Paenibacillus psychroresistens]
MYKVLLVDDERIILESLKASLDWESFGFSICGTAENGIVALERIKELRPDVVFTDIRMPGISGLEFIKKAKEISNCLFVIISGIAEFSYAQKAITFGIEGYCLKPFDEDEIISILKKLGDKLSKMTVAPNYEFVWKLTEKQVDNSQLLTLQDKLNNLGFEPGDGYVVCMIRGSHPKQLNGLAQPYIHIETGIAKMAILVNSSRSEALKAWIQAKLSEYQDWSVGWDSCKTIDTLYLAFERADIAVYQYFLHSANRLHEFKLPNEIRINDYQRKLKEAVEKLDLEASQPLMDSAWLVMQEHNASIQAVVRLYFTVVSSLDLEADSSSYIYGYETLVKQFADFSELIEFLKKLLSSYAGSNVESVPPAIDHVNLKKIIEDVDNRFMDSALSIRELSNQYYIHPNYLSQLFKKHLGETFTDYVMQKRVHYASHLLKHTDLTIKLIGEKCGYTDYFHFAKIFKKMTGVTPSMYRGG